MSLGPAVWYRFSWLLLSRNILFILKYLPNHTIGLSLLGVLSELVESGNEELDFALDGQALLEEGCERGEDGLFGVECLIHYGLH